MSAERGAHPGIGGGNDGAESLTPRALTIVEKADVLVGGQRLLDWFPHVPAERVKIGARVDEVLVAVAARRTTRPMRAPSPPDPHHFPVPQALPPPPPPPDLPH